MANISIYLERDVLKKIDNLSIDENRSRSYIVNEILKHYFMNIVRPEAEGEENGE